MVWVAKFSGDSGTGYVGFRRVDLSGPQVVVVVTVAVESWDRMRVGSPTARLAAINRKWSWRKNPICDYSL